MAPRPLSEPPDHLADADGWLASHASDPDAVRAMWEAGHLAPIPSGSHWLVAEIELTAGYPAAARIREEYRGPVLSDHKTDQTWWLVPPSAADDLADLRQVTVHDPGWVLYCPPFSGPMDSRWWLWRPDGTGQLTDPAVLAAALGPGGTYRLATQEAPS